MKKENLETFIKKYNLGDLIPKVKWKYGANQKLLHTRAAADNKSFVVDVIMNDFQEFGPNDLVVCIGDTKKIKSMMSPFGDDINLAINTSGDRVLGFSITDDNCESYCTAADPTSIDPVAKNLQDVPDYQVEVPLTEEVIEKFLKARGALNDVESFTVAVNKKGQVEFVIGYTTANSNRIRFTPPTNVGKDKLDSALSFPLNNVYEALKANSDITDGLLSVNNMGIMRLSFKSDKYACTYYQFANKKA